MKQATLPAAVLFLVVAPAAACAQNYRFEAELGTLDGTSIQSATPGYSGTGYVNFNSGNSVTVQADVPGWSLRVVARLYGAVRPCPW